MSYITFPNIIVYDFMIIIKTQNNWYDNNIFKTIFAKVKLDTIIYIIIKG